MSLRRMMVAALLALGVAGCGGAAVISPNDPDYARSGAPRRGEPVNSPEDMYGRIMGPDSNGGNL